MRAEEATRRTARVRAEGGDPGVSPPSTAVELRIVGRHRGPVCSTPVVPFDVIPLQRH